MFKKLSLSKMIGNQSGIYKINEDLFGLIFEYLTLGDLKNVSNVDRYLNDNAQCYLNCLKLVHKFLDFYNKKSSDNKFAVNIFEELHYGLVNVDNFSLKTLPESNAVLISYFKSRNFLPNLNEFSDNLVNMFGWIKVSENEFVIPDVANKFNSGINFNRKIKLNIYQNKINFSCDIELSHYNLNLFLRQINYEFTHELFISQIDYDDSQIEESCCCNPFF